MHESEEMFVKMCTLIQKINFVKRFLYVLID